MSGVEYESQLSFHLETKESKVNVWALKKWWENP